MKNKPTTTSTVLAGLVEGKNASRRRKAKLPFKRKVEIVVRLQEIATGIGRAAGRKPVGTVWRLPARRRSSS